MKTVILANAASTGLFNWAKRIYSVLANKINVEFIEINSKQDYPKDSVVLQFLPQANYTYFNGCKNIGISKIKIDYPYNEIVDEIWYDMPDIILNTNNLQYLSFPHTAGEFIFYSIVEDNPEYIENILYAFTKEFDPAEPVSLILKTNKIIDDIILKINTNLGLYDKLEHYKKHTIISKQYSINDRFSLHVTGDSFINPTQDLILYEDELKFFGVNIVQYCNSPEILAYLLRDNYNENKKHVKELQENKDVLNYLMEKIYND